MQKNGFAVKTVTAISAGLIAGIIGSAAPAAAAPAPTGDAQQTIDQLRAQGYRVIVSRLSSRSLDEARVIGIRQGQDFSQNWIDDDDDRNYVYNDLAGKTVYVDVS